MDAALTAFNAGTGFVLNDGVWTVTGANQLSTAPAFCLAGSDLKVLLGQFTVANEAGGAAGHVSLHFNLQWFPHNAGIGGEIRALDLALNTAAGASVPGCTNAAACNYNSAATLDNGSCIVPTGCDSCSGGALVDGDTDNDGVCNANEVVGCQTSTACNYNPLATDSGTCTYATGCDTCVGGVVLDGDADNDGVCNCNEVLGCTDSSATNYSTTATEEDGSCTYGPAQCGGAETVTFDGHTYVLVAIGTQCWFAENLRSDNYRNGDAIPGNLSDAQWTSTSSGAQTVYGEGSSAVYDGSSDEVANLATYGRLYNWYAVNDSRGLCPSGFHVPSDGEWTVLENELGGSSVAGNALKSSSSDTPPWNGTNSSGFSALPGGLRDYDFGYFYFQGYGGSWWSSSPNGSDACNLYLNSNSNVPRSYNLTRGGYSVRCVRD
jgi:uncharacterized protein (TIGR02145 family)